MSHKSIITTGILVFFIEIAVIVLWFNQAQPASESALPIFYVIPILIGANLLLGLLFYFIKKPIGLLFLANSILCPILFYAAWIMWFTYWSQ